MGLLSGGVAVVTGAGSGLGREYAIALAARGVRVVVNDVSVSVVGEQTTDQSADDVVADITARGGVAVANHASVADWEGAESIIRDAIRHFGGLDIVINNAGINRPSSLVELSEQDVDAQLSVHLKGTLAVSHFAAAYWNDVGFQPNRAIVNTTSAVGLHPTAGGGVYGAAKSAIAALTVSHAQELAKLGVRVNAIAPCARTRMVIASPNVLALMPEAEGFDRHDPSHVTPLVLYLASEVCRFTGRVFAIEGPDVAIYRPFGVEQHWSTQEFWTPESLAQALSAVAEQSTTEAFFPGGVVQHRTPPSRTLRALDH
ncbi:MAG: SDR family NAD(P)-dependent oxidoreductase [Ilumatobacteraceae bacterium]|jgi:NAD(P)-dependent dehydrogenase (short-subunit alcohol dehydrogenase family)